MTRNEYMKILTHKLRRLPKDDYYSEIARFEEYFDEAGPDQEQQAIEDLGSPEEAAKALIVDLAAANVKEPAEDDQKGTLCRMDRNSRRICRRPLRFPWRCA